MRSDIMIKKPHPKFNIPNFGSKHRKRVKERWRKQRGIDNKKRVKRSGYGAVPNIGYKNNDGIRDLRPDGTMELLVHNEKELVSAAGKKEISVVFAHGLSKRTRLALGKVADQKGIRVVNKLRQ